MPGEKEMGVGNSQDADHMSKRFLLLASLVYATMYTRTHTHRHELLGLDLPASFLNRLTISHWKFVNFIRALSPLTKRMMIAIAHTFLQLNDIDL